MNDKQFMVYHDDFKEEFCLKCITNDENLQSWVDLPSHTNIVTCLDSFFHDGKQFQLTEFTNEGYMYQYIQSLRLDLALQVPMQYMETIYDCIIQLSLGMEFAHNNGLVHG